MSMTKGTPASSQIITLERLLAEATERADGLAARVFELESALATARNRALEEVAEVYSLHSALVHDAILALRTKEPE